MRSHNVTLFMTIYFHFIFGKKNILNHSKLLFHWPNEALLLTIISCLKVTFATLTLFFTPPEQSTTAAWNEKQILIFAGVTLECEIWEAQGVVEHSPFNDTFTFLFYGQFCFSNNSSSSSLCTCQRSSYLFLFDCWKKLPKNTTLFFLYSVNLDSRLLLSAYARFQRTSQLLNLYVNHLSPVSCTWRHNHLAGVLQMSSRWCFHSINAIFGQQCTDDLEQLLKATITNSEKLVSIEVSLWEEVRACSVISVQRMAFTSALSH